jgi:electron transfer flavoprotein beta subunit
MGVDKAVILKAGTEDFDSSYVSNNLADFAKEINPDLILFGRQSIDYDSFQIPSMLSAKLNMPAISVVSKLEIADGKINAERDIEGGKEQLEASLPCIISTQKGLNEPRYPKLPDIMKAKKKPIDERDAKDYGNTTEVISMEIPTKDRAGKILGDSDADIAEVVRALHEDAKVI